MMKACNVMIEQFTEVQRRQLLVSQPFGTTVRKNTDF